MKVLGCYLREVVLHFKVSVFLQMLPATQRDKSRSWNLHSFGPMAVCCPYFHKFQEGISTSVQSVLTVLALLQQGCLLWEVLVFGCPIFSTHSKCGSAPSINLSCQIWAQLCRRMFWHQVVRLHLHSRKNIETTRIIICSGSAVGNLGWRTAVVCTHGYAQMTSTCPPSLLSFWAPLPKAELSGIWSSRKKICFLCLSMDSFRTDQKEQCWLQRALC